ncbi:hypothetical protein KP509_12G096300 [Ceratopteris richardii]|uniref:VQ domain-containing protein n=1 Tax=Ceratopteris richardii TaxID=49495 RepID=A0A8T2TR53_CERRI|nr:hypothetical protein KP509_12G096300 [Ceratopteris richardii]
MPPPASLPLPSRTLLKRKRESTTFPVIKVIQVDMPTLVHTDIASFRSTVQTLTGNALPTQTLHRDEDEWLYTTPPPPRVCSTPASPFAPARCLYHDNSLAAIHALPDQVPLSQGGTERSSGSYTFAVTPLREQSLFDDSLVHQQPPHVANNISIPGSNVDLGHPLKNNQLEDLYKTSQFVGEGEDAISELFALPSIDLDMDILLPPLIIRETSLIQ